MLDALRQRDFALLWFAGFISLTGDRVLSIALPFFVYDQTGSVLATGAMFAAQRLPPLLVSAVAGVLVDRLDRRRALVVADLLRGLLLLSLLFVRSVDGLWIVYVVAFAESAVSQFAGPAKGALLPRLVPEGQLPAANALVAQAGALTTFVGPTLGGALMALLGLPSVVVVDVASYLGSALLISLISARVGLPATGEPKLAARRGPAAALIGVWRDWLAGLRLVRADRVVSSLFGLFGIILLAQGMLDVLWLAFVRDLLGGGPLVLGWLAAIAGGGILVGGFVVGRLGRRVPPGHLIAASGVLAGVVFVVRANVPVLPVTMALEFLLYVPVIVLIVSQQTLLQRSVADEYRGRVFGALATTNALLALVGLGIAGVGVPVVGIVPLLDLAGALWVGAGFLAFVRFATSPVIAATRPGGERIG